MTHDRFNAIVQGPLSHPMLAMQINRLAIALLQVVEATGQLGEDALEQVAGQYAARDGNLEWRIKKKDRNSVSEKRSEN